MNCAETAWKTLLEPAWTQGSPRKQSGLVKRQPFFGATSSMGVWGRAVEWQQWHPEMSNTSFKPQERVNSAGGWRSLSFLILYVEVPESEEGDPMANPAIYGKHGWIGHVRVYNILYPWLFKLLQICKLFGFA